ncbi:Ecto-ADP-ribosyltransferase 5 [Merluccius polli]|uniref:NAD(P)(+)--arginine ADP-ribosyltransferase n=1 Tax=Merluccius polli TaxID=89951 RepID=A0AA47P5M3_MERPO|nr:Ecto-ADP-ribosyltransferase 5 [Merluccius polli]
MAPDAVDDMYLGCTKEMEDTVQKIYFKKEYSDKIFKTAWTNAQSCANRKKDKGDEALTKNHLQAICAYTSNDIYKQFNNAVRTAPNCMFQLTDTDTDQELILSLGKTGPSDS